MSNIERRFMSNKNYYSDRRTGANRQTTAERLAGEQQGNERRSEDRRKHCMHCGMPYKIELTGTRACVCRIAALRGTP
jgi:hypothetical protein